MQMGIRVWCMENHKFSIVFSWGSGIHACFYNKWSVLINGFMLVLLVNLQTWMGMHANIVGNQCTIAGGQIGVHCPLRLQWCRDMKLEW